MSGFILFLKEFTHVNFLAKIFEHYLFFTVGQVKLYMEKYQMTIYLSPGKYKV